MNALHALSPYSDMATSLTAFRLSESVSGGAQAATDTVAEAAGDSVTLSDAGKALAAATAGDAAQGRGMSAGKASEGASQDTSDESDNKVKKLQERIQELMQQIQELQSQDLPQEQKQAQLMQLQTQLMQVQNEYAQALRQQSASSGGNDNDATSSVLNAAIAAVGARAG
jgi:TolA-binding protein